MDVDNDIGIYLDATVLNLGLISYLDCLLQKYCLNIVLLILKGLFILIVTQNFLYHMEVDEQVQVSPDKFGCLGVFSEQICCWWRDLGQWQYLWSLLLSSCATAKFYGFWASFWRLLCYYESVNFLTWGEWNWCYIHLKWTYITRWFLLVLHSCDSFANNCVMWFYQATT